jgi:hypothetical protein
MAPDPDQIAEWKHQHGEVYTAALKSRTYIFRALKFTELDLIKLHFNEDFSSADAEDLIVAYALLYPEGGLDAVPAGVVSTLSDQIQKVSGSRSPKDVQAIMDRKRGESLGFRNLMKAYILATMPMYREEELDDMNFSQLAAKVALSEQILAIQQQAAMGGSPTLEVTDPEEEARKEEERRRKANKKMEEALRRGGHFDQNKAPPMRPPISPDDPIAQQLRS